MGMCVILKALTTRFWGPKLVLWIVLVVLSFFVPEQFFLFWGNYVALVGSVLFILYGLVLLVDFAHSWAETCLEKYEATESAGWQTVLIGSTFVMFAASLALTIVMFIFFAASGCSLNQAFISVNLALSILATAMSIHPTVQEYNTRSGLAQAAMVCIYGTYLTMSAVANEPDDHQCNPLARSRGTQTASVIVGAIFTFLAISYSTTRAATQTSSLGAASVKSGGYVRVDDAEHGLVRTEPSTRARMRSEALLAAVESGALPSSALDSSDDEASVAGDDRDDERSGVQYHYSTFHLVFFLATCYTACLLTSWGTFQIEKGHGEDDFVAIGRSYAVVWVKVVSTWVCYGLYYWTLLAPVVMPDRY
ncbi:Membrane protein TMS1 [Neolecta irregularis DAH-3]|uniref:Membrane protein TMS1 n=1 Tax=Neolecta irregularis (strain DAH-3) TaxID=1198029 RepID=A0A1U7LNN6_NEOID|nr:Membrane protein TMS1 [Neolecta irregularis DAH-3]|eukprot:OLL24264.1 Membrane protein TMS1 [Neolecta irregularis DAH-3]